MKRFALLALLFTSMISFSSASEPLAVGSAAPKVAALSEAGVSINLADMYSKQKYTLIYFCLLYTSPSPRDS